MGQQTGLKQKLNDDLKQAMKSGDTVRRNTLRMLLAAIKNAEIEKHAELDDSEIIAQITREVKRHNESIEAFTQGNRVDLVTREKAELAILQSYLPQQMTPEELKTLIRQVITTVGAAGPADKGKVMKELMPKVKGKADGKLVNDLVTAALNQ